MNVAGTFSSAREAVPSTKTGSSFSTFFTTCPIIHERKRFVNRKLSVFLIYAGNSLFFSPFCFFYLTFSVFISLFAFPFLVQIAI